jgi:ABC-type Na+ transport system ATPase subunit NatA
MPQLTIEYSDASERLALEQAIAYVADLHRLAQSAADGTVLKVCEDLALDKGREMLRTTLSTALNGRVDAAEQKGGRLARVSARTPDAPRVSIDATS